MLEYQSDVESYQDELLTVLDPLLMESEKIVGKSIGIDKRPQSNCKEFSENSRKLWRSGSATTSLHQLHLTGGVKEKNYSFTPNKFRVENYISGSKSVLPFTNSVKGDVISDDVTANKSSNIRSSTTSLYSAASRFAARYGDEDDQPLTKSKSMIKSNHSNNHHAPSAHHQRIPQFKNRITIPRARIPSMSGRDNHQEASDKDLCLVTRDYIDGMINKLAAASMIDIGCNTLPLGASFQTEITEKDVCELHSKINVLSKELKRERERVMASEQALDNLRTELSSKSSEALSLRQTCCQQETHLEELESSVKRLVVEVANKEQENEEMMNKLRSDCENMEIELNKTIDQKLDAERRETHCRKKHEEITKRLTGQIKQLEHDFTSTRLNEQNLTTKLENLQSQYNLLDTAKKEEKSNWYHQVTQWEAHNKNEQMEKKNLMKKIEELNKVNSELHNSLSKQQEEYNSEMNALRLEINNRENEWSCRNKELENHLKLKFSEKLTKRVNDLKSQQSTQMQEINEKMSHQVRNEIESIRREHSQEVDKLIEESTQMKFYIQQCEDEKKQLHQENEFLIQERGKLLESMKSMMSVYCQEALQFLSRPTNCPTENLISLTTPRSPMDESAGDLDFLGIESISSSYQQKLTEELSTLWSPNVEPRLD